MRKQRRVFISAEKSIFDSIANNIRTAELKSMLSNTEFKPVLGSYNGVHETSFVVLAPVDSILEQCKGLAGYFGQESILIVDELDKAKLLMLETNKEVELDGKFRKVETVDGLTSYSMIGGEYYTVI